ncbi:hypothetical protein FG379_000915 [Cryptosporidium bovis]|uniref:uncharacterized protein n=1 Tax=Cryptosporidium bovis TaxID=310047 RepID=UPI00351A7205|nr:hypothetical protein FG379_000915 [Cryptosporidium bovis]
MTFSMKKLLENQKEIAKELAKAVSEYGGEQFGIKFPSESCLLLTLLLLLMFQTQLSIVRF